MTRPTCRHSCTLPDESRGIYFRIGMTPPRSFTVVPRRAQSRIRFSQRVDSSVRFTAVSRTSHTTINRYIHRSADRTCRVRRKRPSQICDRLHAISRTNEQTPRNGEKVIRMRDSTCSIKNIFYFLFSVFKHFVFEIPQKYTCMFEIPEV